MTIDSVSKLQCPPVLSPRHSTHNQCFLVCRTKAASEARPDPYFNFPILHHYRATSPRHQDHLLLAQTSQYGRPWIDRNQTSVQTTRSHSMTTSSAAVSLLAVSQRHRRSEITAMTTSGMQTIVPIRLHFFHPWLAWANIEDRKMLTKTSKSICFANPLSISRQLLRVHCKTLTLRASTLR